MSRMIALIQDYSTKRVVFGKTLSEQPLHILQVAQMKFCYEGNFVLFLEVVKMHARSELDKDYKNKDLLRLLLPMTKLFAGRCSEEICLEGIQCFGGVGYMENSFIPQILRDTIVTSIWEGSINLLSFDFMKVSQSNKTIFGNILKKIEKRFNLM
jgi:acyl-CoA dehydrogenase